VIDVATVAKKFFTHFTAPSTGHIDSLAATCIALATSRPGATKSR
jgi:hypothetical protein